MARPTDCTEEMTKEIAGGIIAGLSNRDACLAAGVTETTFYNWMKWGQAEDDRVNGSGRRKVHKRKASFVEFFKTIKKAKAQRKRTLLARIQQAARGGEEYTETRRTLRRHAETGQLQVIEETTAVKTRHAEWTAAAWLLERIHPDEFGRRTRVDVHDWREEARKAGYDPDSIFDGLVAQFTAAMVSDDASGGDGEGSEECEPGE